jgi:hypothetical protein
VTLVSITSIQTAAALLLAVTGLALILRRGGRVRTAVGWLLIVAGLVLGVSAASSEFWAVDRCLDRGGRYDYENAACVYR